MTGHAPFLLINNNNSRTKFVLSEADRLVAESHRALETPLVNEETLRELLAGWSFDRVVLASVVPEKAAVLRGFFRQPVVEVSHRVALGIEVDFPHPETVGADRLANAAAVAARGDRLPVIVVDFGTAVTFDIIARGPAYIGGVIAPGLNAMRDYLSQRTALLPEIDLKEPPAAIGRSTEEAMLSGAVHGYRGLVREILARTSAELAERDPGAGPPKIIATGGHAGLIAAGLPEIDEVSPLLTLEGLRSVGNLNLPSPS